MRAVEHAIARREGEQILASREMTFLLTLLIDNQEKVSHTSVVPSVSTLTCTQRLLDIL